MKTLRNFLFGHAVCLLALLAPLTSSAQSGGAPTGDVESVTASSNGRSETAYYKNKEEKVLYVFVSPDSEGNVSADIALQTSLFSDAESELRWTLTKPEGADELNSATDANFTYKAIVLGSYTFTATATTAATVKVILILVEVVELAPKLRDDDGNEIAGSEKPKPNPQSNAMVERDPAANQNDAAAIRIAWRELKVKIGSALMDKKVTWSMDPLFTRSFDPNSPNLPPVFRGSWDRAVAGHRDRFEASTAFTAHSYRRVSQEQGETTIDADGFTALRVNVPPIGLNKARIKIQIEGTTSPIELINLEVPGVIVIDPGHGIGAAGGSNEFGTEGVTTKAGEHRLL